MIARLKYGFWLIAVCLLLPAIPAGAQIYTDMTVNNQHSTDISGSTYWKGSGFKYYVGVGVDDSTNYSPKQTFTNTGNINLSNMVHGGSFSFVYGLVNENSKIDLHNDGNITMSYGANDTSIFTYAIRGTGDIVNNGDININIVRQGVWYYIWSTGINGTGNSLVNTGNINMYLDSGTISSGSSSGIVSGQGITFTGNTLTNSGNITVEGRGTTLTGSGSTTTDVYGINTSGSLHNTGVITARAYGGKKRPNSSTPFTGADSTAYGIYASGSLNLHSEGLIWADAFPAPGQSDGTQTAYQVYVSSGTTTITGYTMRLSSQSQLTSTYNGAIKVKSGAGLAFNNAVLYLCTCNNFAGQGVYEIPTLEEGGSAVDQFVSVGSMPAEYEVELINGNGSGLQKIKFTYNPQEDTSVIGTEIMNAFDMREHSMIRANVSHGIVRGMVPSRDMELSALDSPAMLMATPGRGTNPMTKLFEDHRNQFFAGPVVLAAYDDSDSGYDAHTRGMLSGYTRHIRDNFYLGIHGGVTDVDVHFTGQGSQFRYEDTLSYSLGTHVVYLLDRSWLFTGLASLFYGDTDYRDDSIHNLETASYESYTGLVELTVGRFTQWRNLTLLPEVGLVTSWNSREAFTTDNKVNADVRHGALEEIEAHLRVGLETYTRFMLNDEVEVMPNVSLGLTRPLSDGAGEVTMGIGQVTRSVAHHSDRTSADVGFTLTLEQDTVSLLGGSSASFSRNSRNYLFWLELGVAF